MSSSTWQRAANIGLIRRSAAYVLGRRRTAVMGDALAGWLGIDRKLFRRAMRRQGYRVFNIVDEGRAVTQTKVPGVDDATLDRIGLYRLCVELEVCPDELPRCDPELVERTRNSLRDELRRLALEVHAQLDALEPQRVVIVQGYEPVAALSRLWAIERGIRVIALENTAVSTRMLWDDISAITTNRNQAHNHYWRFCDQASQVEVDSYVRALVGQRRELKSAEHSSPKTEFVGRDAGKPVVLFLGQVYTDSSVIFGIGGWGTPVKIVRSLVELSKVMGFDLVVKLHPKEAAGSAPMTNEPYDQLTWRKLMDDPIVSAALEAGGGLSVDGANEFDTYSMINRADAVVTLNSQAGLEAACEATPTVTCGAAFYTGLGFTLEAHDHDALHRQLARALQLGAAERHELAAAARRFTYVYFQHYCIERDPEELACLVAR